MVDTPPGRSVTVPTDLVSAPDAAALLGVKTATIYTYVTRGHLHAHRKPGDRSSWFSRSEVEGLLRRPARRPESTPAREVASAITLIADGHYWYRGAAPTDLARTKTFEEVAEFLWTGSMPESCSWPVPSGGGRRARAVIERAELPLDALRVAAALIGPGDELRFGTDPEAVVVLARDLLPRLVGMLPMMSAPADPSFAALVWSRLCTRPPRSAERCALDGALILMADHGLAPSTLAVRVAASYRADPYAAIQAGLAIVAGGWHGGRAVSAEAMLMEMAEGRSVAAVIGDRLRAGSVPALGQPRYPDGDPRFGVIMEMVAATEADDAAVRSMHGLLAVTRDRALPRPSVEFGLALLSHAFGFVRGASEALFAIGRMAGWIAHAIEEYEAPVPAAPAFRYVGRSPLEA